jgi:hypothetical protein
VQAWFVSVIVSGSGAGYVRRVREQVADRGAQFLVGADRMADCYEATAGQALRALG